MNSLWTNCKQIVNDKKGVCDGLPCSTVPIVPGIHPVLWWTFAVRACISICTPNLHFEFALWSRWICTWKRCLFALFWWNLHSELALFRRSPYAKLALFPICTLNKKEAENLHLGFYFWICTLRSELALYIKHSPTTLSGKSLHAILFTNRFLW